MAPQFQAIFCSLVYVLYGCRGHSKRVLRDTSYDTNNRGGVAVFNPEEWGLNLSENELMENAAYRDCRELIHILQSVGRLHHDKSSPAPRFPSTPSIIYLKGYIGDKADPSGSGANDIIAKIHSREIRAFAVQGGDEGFASYKIEGWLESSNGKSKGGFYEISVVTADLSGTAARQTCPLHSSPSIVVRLPIAFEVVSKNASPVELISKMIHALVKKEPWICSISIKLYHLSTDLKRIISRQEGTLSV